MEASIKGRRLLAEIDLDNIIYNYRQVQQCAPGCEVCCVVKANAYGHGAVPVALALAEAGVRYFAVATPEEALQLRKHGIRQNILLLCPTDTCWVQELAEKEISLTVGSALAAAEYAAAAGEHRLKIHVKLETGMARLGIPYQNAPKEILALAANPSFELEGLFTHFSAADEDSIIIVKDGRRREGLLSTLSTKQERLANDFTNMQMERFLAVNRLLQKHSLNIPLLHCACSAAIIAYPNTHATMVRPGIMLYGSNPLGSSTLSLKPALSLKARVAQLSLVKQGESVGYGRAWYAQRDSQIATISLGYGDGLTRFLSGKLPLLLHGHKARQVGRICMDMCMVDVTDIPHVSVGDYATIIGKDGDIAITVEQVAEAAGTIAYEILCALGLRVPRIYYRNGQLIEQVNYLDQL
ncbi:MAG: alanine racemase [Clostridiales bacterium]|nr:alanine racemase [Clostridiales bacterium]